MMGTKGCGLGSLNLAPSARSTASRWCRWTRRRSNTSSSRQRKFSAFWGLLTPRRPRGTTTCRQVLQEHSILPLANSPLVAIRMQNTGFRPRLSRLVASQDTNVVVAEPGSEKASQAVSAVVQAMSRTGQVALVKAAWRNGATSVVLGVLTPFPVRMTTAPPTGRDCHGPCGLRVKSGRA